MPVKSGFPFGSLGTGLLEPFWADTEMEVMEVHAKPPTSTKIIEIKMAVAKLLFMANSLSQ